jgi:tetraacyldisaccharide 4'-kinase
MIMDAAAAPFEFAYRRVVGARNRRFDAQRGIRVEGLRVVSVGNLVVGGTGKTPVAAWIVRELAEAGASPALISGGYAPDEPELHRDWNPELPVYSARARVAAARAARRGGADMAVLDDGFQHRALARDLDILVLAAEDGAGGRLLPRGPWREPFDSARRADAVLVTRRTASRARAEAVLDAAAARMAPGVPLASLRLAPGRWLDLAGRVADAPDGKVLAAAAVARPEAFQLAVAGLLGRGVDIVAFPDHYAFTTSDARALRRRAGTRTLVITEKDAVKLRRFPELLGAVRVLTQELEWEEGREALSVRLRAVVGAGAS